MTPKKKSNPRISVLVSIYNGEKYLSETMDSILNQTFKDFEFIIVNDGSQDNTLNILREYAKKDGRIIIINNKKNLGLINSLNKGLKIAKGKYIARMDTDDLYAPNRFEVQYDYLEKNKDIFLVGSYSINMDENGKKISLFKPPTNPDVIAKTLEKENCMYQNTVMFRNTGKYYYREKMIYVEDYDFFTNLITAGEKIANIPLFLVKYRRLPYSTSFSKRGFQELFGIKATEFFIQRLKRGFDDYDSFDPQEILKINIDDCTDNAVMESIIIATFALNNLSKARRLIKKYFKFHGVLKKPSFIFYYVATFFNKDLLKIIKKSIQILRKKY